jgi:hypothetical protein
VHGEPGVDAGFEGGVLEGVGDVCAALEGGEGGGLRGEKGEEGESPEEEGGEHLGGVGWKSGGGRR